MCIRDRNAGPHLENSGSGPLKKVRAGEVAIAFGLRHQAVADRKAGLPIDYGDPAEGNFMLTESVCVTDKGAGGNPLAMKMARMICSRSRPTASPRGTRSVSYTHLDVYKRQEQRVPLGLQCR